MKDLPAHERPREKLLTQGADSLRDSELLAILLRTGTKGKSVLKIAEEILRKYPKRALLDVSYEDLKKVKGISAAKAATLLAAFALSGRILEAQQSGRPLIETVEQAVAQIHDIRTHKREHFVALYLNARNELIHRENISVGTVNASIIHPRDVFAPAIENNATSVIVAHNHPSGDTTPSPEDREVTVRLKEAGQLLGISLLSHVVVTKDSHSTIPKE